MLWKVRRDLPMFGAKSDLEDDDPANNFNDFVHVEQFTAWKNILDYLNKRDSRWKKKETTKEIKRLFLFKKKETIYKEVSRVCLGHGNRFGSSYNAELSSKPTDCFLS